MFNQCQFIGNLGADPEIRSTQSGQKIANLRLAVTEKWTSNGEKKEKTEWVTVVIFGDGLSGVAERFLRKGSKIFVSGKMATRKWQDQSGNDRYSTEIVLSGPQAVLTMLDGPHGGNERPRNTDSGRSGGFGKGQEGHIPGWDDDGSEPPF